MKRRVIFFRLSFGVHIYTVLLDIHLELLCHRSIEATLIAPNLLLKAVLANRYTVGILMNLQNSMTNASLEIGHYAVGITNKQS